VLPVAKTLAEVDAVDATGVARRLELHIDHLPPSAAFQIDILDRNHGNAIATWEKCATRPANMRTDRSASQDGLSYGERSDPRKRRGEEDGGSMEPRPNHATALTE
jgi:hypothetical protein